MAMSAGKYSRAVDRWVGMGPYYAMFPSAFADRVVDLHSKPGDTVLDPFAGRGTSLFSAATLGRKAFGVEVNPVGWVYSKTKLNPAPKEQVCARIREIEACSIHYKKLASKLPPFFQRGYCSGVRAFLVCARETLDWKMCDVDRTAMAFILVNLHGKAKDSLSNQMMQTKAVSPQYAIDWWASRELKPPTVKPAEYFEKKLGWRYGKGVPVVASNCVLLGDSANVLKQLRGSLQKNNLNKASLMLTSPPYFGITNYHYDQWIRLWLLGGPPTDRRIPTQFNGKHQGKFANLSVYTKLLDDVFLHSKYLMKPNAVVYVRTDRREPTVSITRNALKKAFPEHELERVNQELKSGAKTQTELFGHHAPRFGEVDFILRPSA